jgi:hypothetical protein
MKVLDFGIAKVMAETASMTRAFEATGGSLQAFTPRYGAPEQFSRRYGATGPWTDVFAFALVLIEVVAGRPALDGEDAAQLFIAASDPNERPSLQRVGVPASEALEAVIKTALAVDPKDRYRTVGEFWNALLTALGGSLDAVAAGSGRRELPSTEHVGMLDRALAATRLAGNRGDNATQLSSSRPLAPGEIEPRRSLPPGAAKTIALFTVAMLAAASAFAIIGFLGHLMWRPSDEELKQVLTTSVPPPNSAPAPGVAAQKAEQPTPQPQRVDRAMEQGPRPRDAAAPARLNAREIPAGRTASGEFWLDRFRLDQFVTTGSDFLEAQNECLSHGMALCTETQWQRACELDNRVGAIESWTGSLDVQGLVVRGGQLCSDRKLTSGGDASAKRVGLCCDIAVPIRTEGVSASLITSASNRMRQFEKSFNARDAKAFEAIFDDGLIVERKPRTKRGAVDFMAQGFAAAPDQWTIVSSCGVSVNVVKTRRRRKPKTQTWSTECNELRHRQGEIALLSGEYVFSMTGKLKGFGEYEIRREWAKP